MAEATKPRRQSKARKYPRSGHERRRGVATASPHAPDPFDADNLDEAFLTALKADFAAHGDEAIAAMRSAKPVDYVKLVAALHTKDTNDKVDPLPGMSDAELERHIEELAAQAGYEIRRAAAPHREEVDGDDVG